MSVYTGDAENQTNIYVKIRFFAAAANTKMPDSYENPRVAYTILSVLSRNRSSQIAWPLSI